MNKVIKPKKKILLDPTTNKVNDELYINFNHETKKYEVILENNKIKAFETKEDAKIFIKNYNKNQK